MDKHSFETGYMRSIENENTHKHTVIVKKNYLKQELSLFKPAPVNIFIPFQKCVLSVM